MPDKQIGNPGGAYGLTADPQYQQVIDCVNNSGGTLVEGDVVVCTDVNGINVTTTTTLNNPQVLGVVGSGAPTSSGLVTGGGAGAIQSGLGAASSTNTYAAGATMPVVVFGPARINIGANAVAAAGVALGTFTTVKQAATVTLAAGVIGAVIAISQEAAAAKDANNTIRAIIMRA